MKTCEKFIINRRVALSSVLCNLYTDSIYITLKDRSFVFAFANFGKVKHLCVGTKMSDNMFGEDLFSVFEDGKVPTKGTTESSKKLSEGQSTR